MRWRVGVWLWRLSIYYGVEEASLCNTLQPIVISSIALLATSNTIHIIRCFPQQSFLHLYLLAFNDCIRPASMTLAL
jgi:hypothetical protein